MSHGPVRFPITLDAGIILDRRPTGDRPIYTVRTDEGAMVGAFYRTGPYRWVVYRPGGTEPQLLHHSGSVADVAEFLAHGGGAAAP